MAAKNSKNNKGKIPNYDILGVSLILISAIALVCLILPFVLGVAGAAVKSFLTGVFGLAAYALFVALLVFGILLIRNKPIGLKLKYALSISIVFLSALSILHLATSYKLLGNSFGEYFKETYKSGLTGGGIIMSLFVYPVYAVTNTIFTYIFYSLIFITAVMVFTDFKLFSLFKRERKQKEQETLPQFFADVPRAPSGYDYGKRDVNPAMREPSAPFREAGSSLYVEDISARGQKVQSKSASANSKAFRDKPLNNDFGVQANTYFGQQPQEKPQAAYTNRQHADIEDYKKSEAFQKAKKELFINKPSVSNYDNAFYASGYNTEKSGQKPMYGNYNDYDSRQDFPEKQKPIYGNFIYNQYREEPAAQPAYENIMPPKSTGAPDIKKHEEKQPAPELKQDNKPPKFFHNSDRSNNAKPAENPSRSFYDGRNQNESFNRYDLTGSRYDAANDTRTENNNAGNRENPLINKRDKPVQNTNYNNPFKTASLFDAAAMNRSAEDRLNNNREAPPKEPVKEKPKKGMYAQTEFPYVPEPLKDFNYGSNPNPIINGDKYTESVMRDKTAEEKQPEKIFEERKEPPRRDPDIRRETPPLKREEIREDLFAEEIRSGVNDVPEYEEAPVDFTGRYTVLPPEEKSKKEQFEEKVASFEQLYPNLKPGAKKPAATKNANQIPIDEFVSRAAENVKPTRLKYNGKQYTHPPLELLDKVENHEEDNGEEVQEKARILEETLAEFKVNAKVVEVTRGPAVTRYELQMPPGISVKNVEKYSEDLAYRLASTGRMRIETPIPGKTAVGIEVPNKKIAIVGLRDIIGSREFDDSKSALTFSLGKDIAGNNIVCDLAKMPHLLVAGQTGSGKSACLNSLIISLIYKSSPEDLRLLLIDPKLVEFSIYKNIPHLLTDKIINETEHTINALDWAVNEMERRYQLLQKHMVRDIGEFNKSQMVKDGTEEKLPFIIIIVDEVGDLMTIAKRDVEDRVRRIAQKARSAGIHLVLATQRPSVDVITGTIKANLPSRIAFAVSSFPDSKTILDQGGAESLLGRGDMLYSPVELHEPIRIQGAYVTTSEVKSVVNFVRENNEAVFDDEASEFIFAKKDEPVSVVDNNNGNSEDDYDTRLKDAARIGIELKQISISLVQRKLYIGYARAARIIDQLEKFKFISPFDGTSKARQVYMTAEDFKDFFGEDF